MTSSVRIDFTFCLVTDRRVLGPGRSLVDAVESALSGGVEAVQLREKDLSARELYRLAVALRERTGRRGARLLVNDRLDVALAAGADGVHLGGGSLPVEEARRILGPHRVIGVSTHQVGEIGAAAAAGADFVTFGPVYPTPFKARYGEPPGVQGLRRACSGARLPVFALGGVRADRVGEIMAAGASGVALISAVLGEEDPEEAAAEIHRALRGTDRRGSR